LVGCLCNKLNQFSNKTIDTGAISTAILNQSQNKTMTELK